MPIIDLTGQRFGRWTVIRRQGSSGGKALWLCMCDCGNEGEVKSTNLRSGKSKSCGCYRKDTTSYRKIYDMVGERFGKLSVIRMAGRKNGEYYWLCMCDCGNDMISRGTHLRSGHTTSCGCYAIDSFMERYKNDDFQKKRIESIRDHYEYENQMKYLGYEDE